MMKPFVSSASPAATETIVMIIEDIARSPAITQTEPG
jgi:hypothetical protein